MTNKIDTGSRKVYKAKDLDELDTFRDRLNPKGDFDDDFAYYTSNDGEKLAMRLEMGYTVVAKEEGISFLDRGIDKLSADGSAVSKPVGGDVQGILMKIPKVLKAQYDKQKSKRVDRTEEAMFAQVTDGEGRHGTIETSSTHDK